MHSSYLSIWWVYRVKKYKVCKKQMAVVKAIGKVRNLEIGHYCFKCKRLVPNKDRVKMEEELI